jgi:hypothetical protein
MEAADFTAAVITGDITAAGTTADITADITAVRFGGHSGGRTTARRSTTVPMLRTMGIRIMGIRQRPHMGMLRHRPRLQPNVTLQWLTKMEG